MLKDTIKNANKYYKLSERLEIGLKYLEDNDFSNMENGKYEILGDKVFAIVQEYLSKPKSEGKFEAHRKYIDIQYVVEGEELIGVGNIENFAEVTEYDNEKDIVFLKQKTSERPVMIDVQAKEFTIFTSNDAHMPSIAAKNPSHVKKVVVKSF